MTLILFWVISSILRIAPAVKAPAVIAPAVKALARTVRAVRAAVALVVEARAVWVALLLPARAVVHQGQQRLRRLQTMPSPLNPQELMSLDRRKRGRPGLVQLGWHNCAVPKHALDLPFGVVARLVCPLPLQHLCQPAAASRSTPEGVLPWSGFNGRRPGDPRPRCREPAPALLKKKKEPDPALYV